MLLWASKFATLKSNVASKWQVNTFGGNIYFAREGTYLRQMVEWYVIFPKRLFIFPRTKWGSFPVVFIATHQLVKKAFNNPDIQGRLDLHSFKLFNGLREGGEC